MYSPFYLFISVLVKNLVKLFKLKVRLLFALLFVSEIWKGGRLTERLFSLSRCFRRPFSSVSDCIPKWLWNWGFVPTWCPLKGCACICKLVVSPSTSYFSTHNERHKTSILGSPHKEQQSKMQMDNLSFSWNDFTSQKSSLAFASFCSAVSTPSMAYSPPQNLTQKPT